MLKPAKRIILILLAILVAVQAPFLYRRYKLGIVARQIASAPASNLAPDTKYREYKGVIHAHTSLGGHSYGGFDELIAAANKNALDFVVMTEHWSDAFDTSALTLNGVYGNTLFVGGSEIDTADSDRFLMIPGSADAPGLRRMPTDAVIAKLHDEKRLAFITYPEKFHTWTSQFDGIEVFSLHTNAKQNMRTPVAVLDGLWSYSAYPDIMLAEYFRRPNENLAKFDEIAARQNITLFAGTDAHSNIGFHLFGDDAGHKFGVKLDPYELIFRLARQHVLLPAGSPLDREALIDGLRSGNSFIGLDVLGDTTGFRFEANAGGTITPMGGEITHAGAATLTATVPADARVVFLRNGEKVGESARTDAGGGVIEQQIEGPGVYRVEVFLDRLGPPFSEMPWIMSNPIFVR